MPKTRQLNFRPSARALAALQYLMDETGMNQTQVIEMALIGEQERSMSEYVVEARYRRRVPTEVEATNAIRQQGVALAKRAGDFSIKTVQSSVTHDMESLRWDAFSIWHITVKSEDDARHLFEDIPDGNGGSGWMYLEYKGYYEHGGQ